MLNGLIDRRRMLGLLVGGALALTACGGNDGGAATASSAPSDSSSAAASTNSDWDAVVEAAKKEGKVTIYSAQGLPSLELLKKAFEADTGITLEIVRGLPAELLPKIEAERQTGRGIADVYVSAEENWTMNVASKEGWYTTPTGPSFEDPSFDADKYFPNGDWFVTNGIVFGFGWNTERYSQGLKEYKDLLDPALSGGKIGVPENSNQALTDFYLYLEETQGADFVKQLGAQKPRLYAGNAALQEALASGEVYAIAYVGGAIEDLKDKGAPVEWALPEKAWGARFLGGIMSTSPHPNAAQVLADYIVSPGGQKALGFRQLSVLPDTPDVLLSFDQLLVRDTAKLTPAVVEDYIKQWKAAFTG